MKKFVLVLIVAALVVPAMAAPTLSFIEDVTPGWEYDASSRLFSFNAIKINWVSGGDTLQNAGWIYLPDMQLSAGNDVLTPIGAVDNFTITDSWLAGGNVLLTGTLGIGNFKFDSGDTTATAYTKFNADILVGTVNNSLGSAFLDAAELYGLLDISITLQTFGLTWEDIVAAGSGTYSDGLSGAMAVIVPAPGAVLLGSIGVSLVGWFRRRKAS